MYSEAYKELTNQVVEVVELLERGDGREEVVNAVLDIGQSLDELYSGQVDSARAQKLADVFTCTALLALKFGKGSGTARIEQAFRALMGLQSLNPVEEQSGQGRETAAVRGKEEEDGSEEAK